MLLVVLKLPLLKNHWKAVLLRTFCLRYINCSSIFPNETSDKDCLVTSEGRQHMSDLSSPLRHWDIRLDESLFLGGRDKGEFLKSFEADIFFDDQAVHCENASSHVASGHVPSGVANE
ncbi:MAG: hypothetical protein Ct9H90mP27_0400 [Gammaproteobacteria bacterium]|nr:MAG: hypothetical protein Ct9H90mP27_0400 [Gammaproteobacteria bacterium]